MTIDLPSTFDTVSVVLVLVLGLVVRRLSTSRIIRLWTCHRENHLTSDYFYSCFFSFFISPLSIYLTKLIGNTVAGSDPLSVEAREMQVHYVYGSVSMIGSVFCAASIV